MKHQPNVSNHNHFNAASQGPMTSIPLPQSTNPFQIPKAQEIIKYDEFEFEKSTIIKPPSHNTDIEGERKFTNVIIDSRDRNVEAYPSPSDYLIDLYEELQDITACELVVADIPFKAYIVNEGNNIIYASQAGNIKQIIIPPGDYPPDDLATQIRNSIQSLVGSVTGASWSVVYDPLVDKFLFYSSAPFSFNFIVEEASTGKKSYPPQSMAKLLGFNKQLATSVLSTDVPDPTKPYVIKAPYRKNFDEHNYIVLDIESFSTNNSVNSVVNKSFGVIPKSSTDMNIITNNYKVRKIFNPPTPRIAKLRIRFKDVNGNLYDFQNHDHRLELVFEGYKQVRRYRSYIDN